MAGGFETPIVGISGVWPDPPSTWSYSSLSEAEACPRRWMLSRARYDGIWDSYGYPEVPVPAAVLGSVVHKAVEIVIDALKAESAASISDAYAAAALRRLGGITAVIDRAIDEELRSLDKNPRARSRIASLRKHLAGRAADVRIRTQALVRRVDLTFVDEENDGHPVTRSLPGTGRPALATGSHTEVDLKSDGLALAGRVDLLTLDGHECSIVDFKTGAAKESHRDQVRIYALLWFLDRERNSKGILASSLQLIYGDEVSAVQPPTREELLALQTSVRSGIGEAVKSVSEASPEARPSPENCAYCSVRQFCNDYWELKRASERDTPDEQSSGFLDCELLVKGALGPRSWSVSESSPPGVNVVVSSDADCRFQVGDRVRLTNALVTVDPDSDQKTASIAYASDAFVLRT